MREMPYKGVQFIRTAGNKQIIRTRLPLGRSGSDYIALVPATGLEPVRFLRRGILSAVPYPYSSVS